MGKPLLWPVPVKIVPFIALERNGLTVLVHPNTEDDLADHRDYAFWMGAMPDLKLSIFENEADA